MPADRQLATSALAFLFFAEGQRAYFATLFALGYDAVFPDLLPPAALLALVPLAALLAPLLPLARRVDRSAAVALAAVGLAVFRLPMTFPDFVLRGVSATLVVASGALFLAWAVGHFDGRAVAAGAIAGLVADQLLRLAGTTWDLSLRPGWLPVQAVLSLALLFLVLGSAAIGSADHGGGDAKAHDETGGGAGSLLERRSGGLRLRGALALGALLFLDLHLLSLPPVVARWTGASYELAALAVSAAGATALAVALLGRGPVRNRNLALGLVLLLGLALGAGPWLGGAPGAVLLALGHGAALLLLARALNPASGRRGRGVATAGMLTFAGLTILYAATFFYAYLFPFLEGAAPWIIGGSVVLVGGAFLLLPQPPASRRRPPVAVALGAATAVLAASAVLVLALGPAAPPPAPPGEAAPVGQGRVATYNIHFGYDGRWRFDPASIAEVVRSAGADIVALQEVPVGMPTAYGIDFPLWLERRLGMAAHFAGSINGLQGSAILAGVPTGGLRAIPLPPREADRKHLLHLPAVLGGRAIDVYALHLSVHEAERTLQLRAALDYIAPDRAILLGDLNAEPESTVPTMLRGEGFRDAFELAGADPAHTWPADEPEMRIDWIWLRDVRADAAEVLEAAPSDHRLVAATLQVEAPNP